MSETFKKPELLAPVGGMDALWAAINNGADAVYLGASSFGARSSAGFDPEALSEAVRIAHFFHRRVYVTVNTLVKQAEWQALCGVLEGIVHAQADAVIVQDVGVLRYVKTRYPQMPVHASTQMGLHSASGARFAKKAGADRVVLAREASLDTIRQTAAAGLETEVFAHGALCVSVSGQCSLSAMVGGRSGNRGRCAQPCRLEYTYKNRKGAWLSPRDTCTAQHVRQLWAAGVASLKIEGRLKRPEYVATVTKAYRQALDESGGPQLDSLKQIFNRGGFSTGYAFGAQDAGIVYPLHVSHEGVPMGRVTGVRPVGGKYLASVRLTLPLHDQDGLEIRGAQASGAIYSGPDHAAGDTVDIRLHSLCRAGDIMYRMDDALLLSAARAGMARDAAPRVGVSASLRIRPSRPAELTLSDGITAYTALGAEAMPARNAPLTAETARRSIAKTDTLPLRVEGFDFLCDEPAFMTAAQLNQLRRDAMRGFIEKRSVVFAPLRARHAYCPQREVDAASRPVPSVIVQGADIDALRALKEWGADCMFWEPVDCGAQAIAAGLAKLDGEDALVLPRQLSDWALQAIAASVRARPVHVVVNSLGQLDHSWPRNVYAGPGIYAWNAQALTFLAEQGVAAATLPRELTFGELAQLPENIMPLVLPVYGRSPLMVLNHCPERVLRGLSGGHASCQLCRQGEGAAGQALTDRRGVSFPLYPVRLPEGCLNYLLDAKPLHVSDRAPRQYGWLLSFTTEEPARRAELVRHYAALRRRRTLTTDVPVFIGRYDAGVE